MPTQQTQRPTRSRLWTQTLKFTSTLLQLGATAVRCQRGSRAQTAESLWRLSNNPGERSQSTTLPLEPGDPLTPVPNRRHIVIHTSLMCHCSGYCFCGEYLEGRFSPSAIIADWKHTNQLREGPGHIWWRHQGQIRSKHVADRSMLSKWKTIIIMQMTGEPGVKPLLRFRTASCPSICDRQSVIRPPRWAAAHWDPLDNDWHWQQLKPGGAIWLDHWLRASTEALKVLRVTLVAEMFPHYFSHKPQCTWSQNVVT